MAGSHHVVRLEHGEVGSCSFSSVLDIMNYTLDFPSIIPIAPKCRRFIRGTGARSRGTSRSNSDLNGGLVKMVCAKFIALQPIG